MGRPGRPLGRSWAGLGVLLERSWACLGRSGAGLGGILRAKRFTEEAQEAPKSSPRGDSSSKPEFFKKCCFSMEFIDFRGPGVAFSRSESIYNGFALQLNCVIAANSLLNRSWSALGGILSALGGSWRLPGAIWAIWEADMGTKTQKKAQARRNAQACSRWFTIVLGGYRRLAAGSFSRPCSTRSAPLSGAAD